MAERKVLNKYYPPDFDPSKIPKLKREKNRQQKVRLMSPFSMRCNTCGQWIGKGTKFNARKETVEGEKFYSILIYRFYIRCTRCNAEITFKTDPGNIGYVCEQGAQRNFEPWRDEEEQVEEERKKKEEEEENNPMRALENRTEESRREMEILDALDEIQTKNALQARVDVDSAIEHVAEKRVRLEELKKKAEDEEIERLVKNAFSTVDGERVKRVRKNVDGDSDVDYDNGDDERDEEERLAKVRQKKLFAGSFGKQEGGFGKSPSSSTLGKQKEKFLDIRVKPKATAQPNPTETNTKVKNKSADPPPPETSSGDNNLLGSLVGGYSSGSDSE
ncbi:Pre-mRNA-splicing factor cwf16 [Mycoemilia scoparia]|uniref:Splicing factor YJU2 n=1 Tax=Mycoemilia scoparia TaxID=417184 RepID=A0A9W8DMU5_9FUNG|nr:Pre-mRNA-splicing factor cwf16 [Mycoemilia scoparia]